MTTTGQGRDRGTRGAVGQPEVGGEGAVGRAGVDDLPDGAVRRDRVVEPAVGALVDLDCDPRAPALRVAPAGAGDAEDSAVRRGGGRESHRRSAAGGPALDVAVIVVTGPGGAADGDRTGGGRPPLVTGGELAAEQGRGEVVPRGQAGRQVEADLEGAVGVDGADVRAVRGSGPQQGPDGRVTLEHPGGALVLLAIRSGTELDRDGGGAAGRVGPPGALEPQGARAGRQVALHPRGGAADGEGLMGPVGRVGDHGVGRDDGERLALQGAHRVTRLEAPREQLQGVAAERERGCGRRRSAVGQLDPGGEGAVRGLGVDHGPHRLVGVDRGVEVAVGAEVDLDPDPGATVRGVAPAGAADPEHAAERDALVAAPTRWRWAWSGRRRRRPPWRSGRPGLRARRADRRAQSPGPPSCQLRQRRCRPGATSGSAPPVDVHSEPSTGMTWSFRYAARSVNPGTSSASARAASAPATSLEPPASGLPFDEPPRVPKKR